MSCGTTKGVGSGGGREVPKREKKNIKRKAEEKMRRGAKAGLQRGEAKGGRPGGRQRREGGSSTRTYSLPPGAKKAGVGTGGTPQPQDFPGPGWAGKEAWGGKGWGLYPRLPLGPGIPEARERGALGPFPPLDLLAAGPALPCSQTYLSFPLAYLQASCVPFFSLSS